MIRILLVVLTTMIGLPLMAQWKHEKEIRVSEKEVPEAAIQLIGQLMPGQKIKWYKEFGKDEISFEAKTKKDGVAYSIEFSEQGAFEDLEKGIHYEDLPASVSQSIHTTLEGFFRTFRIEKVQIQYSGNVDVVMSNYQKAVETNGMMVRFEVIVSAKEARQFVEYEFLFDIKGAFLQRQQIMQKDTQNLEY